MGRAVWARARRGFTLAELAVVITVLLLLAGIFFVAFGAVTESARSAQAQSETSSVQFGVETFDSTFGFLPPLVRDNPNSLSNIVGPLDDDVRFRPSQVVPGFYLDRTGDDPAPGGSRDGSRLDYEVLTGETFNQDERHFSVYSLPYYVVGALPAEHDSLLSPDGVPRSLDGIDGPAFFPPEQAGGWAISTNIDVTDEDDPLRSTLDLETYESFVDVGTGSLSVERTANAPDDAFRPYRLELRGSNGAPIRYYRWSSGRWDPEAAGGQGGYLSYQNLPRFEQDVAALNVPDIFGDPANDFANDFWNGGDPTLSPAFTNTELRGAEYAVVNAGPNGVFGDEVLVMGSADNFEVMEGTLPLDEGRRVLAAALNVDEERLLDGGALYRALVEARSDNVFQLGASR
ncbi:MAG: type II secretion system protein [Planctomycetota bacterium]